MTHLIDDLLDVSRISHNALHLRKEQVDLASVVRHAVEAVEPLVAASNHRLDVQVPAESIFLHADPTRLSQVVSNLLNNAVKYTDVGGRICLTVERTGSDVSISVRDTGIGIPAEMLGKVFELFSQVDRSLERARGGLGIGLTLVKQLVELHDGRVEARSEGPGRGSEFIVRLPVLTRPRAQPRHGGQAGKAPEPVSLAGRRILVVDDNQDAAKSLAALLKIMGGDVQTAFDGSQALAAAERRRPDVIFLDIGLPNLSSYDVCRRIRNKPWGAHVLLVALTGWGQDEDRRKSKEAGFDQHLVKPADYDDVARVLAEHRPAVVAPSRPC
jgi:CheY-like chemotaxis protein